MVKNLKRIFNSWLKLRKLLLSQGTRISCILTGANHAKINQNKVTWNGKGSNYFPVGILS